MTIYLYIPLAFALLLKVAWNLALPYVSTRPGSRDRGISLMPAAEWVLLSLTLAVSSWAPEDDKVPGFVDSLLLGAALILFSYFVLFLSAVAARRRSANSQDAND